MKRLNYYQVHKNKKAKVLKRKSKKPNIFCLEVKAITMMSLMQNAIIVSQQFKSIAEKSLEVAKNIINHAEAISKLTIKHYARTPNRTRRTYST